eukprot:CAMPEP_0206246944 /NCGR_PEP_ID=MMETSP0047_2-20121206/19542_1 /ASSEMBLY_ACC=CAM_ASM_000192 /TAXON_ID=195065 /ORGANISM="Chroomonas mesostigmatica_cf, Strain CCMP1168" /LENGTH=40 /DNA_ID= /DNA_START= /DNA_END= /DNA_ORIENTATION=
MGRENTSFLCFESRLVMAWNAFERAPVPLGFTSTPFLSSS